MISISKDQQWKLSKSIIKQLEVVSEGSPAPAILRITRSWTRSCQLWPLISKILNVSKEGDPITFFIIFSFWCSILLMIFFPQCPVWILQDTTGLCPFSQFCCWEELGYIVKHQSHTFRELLICCYPCQIKEVF